MQMITFKSAAPQTPFAPSWNYVMGSDFIKKVDFKKVAQIILKKEKNLIKTLPRSYSKENLSSDGYTELGPNSLTSRSKAYNIFKWKEKEFQKIKKEILNFHEIFLNKLGIIFNKPLFLKGWANVMRKGQRIKPHLHAVHPQTYLSGHIVVQCNDTSTFYMNPVNQLNDPLVHESKNQVGMMTLFPACIPHYTNLHEGPDERITIAFDMSLKENKNDPI
tara:strand:- start:52 stop:708 length:657 start_codon:yes stop_codon:yes gene_type:complete